MDKNNSRALIEKDYFRDKHDSCYMNACNKLDNNKLESLLLN